MNKEKIQQIRILCKKCGCLDSYILEQYQTNDLDKAWERHAELIEAVENERDWGGGLDEAIVVYNTRLSMINAVKRGKLIDPNDPDYIKKEIHRVLYEDSEEIDKEFKELLDKWSEERKQINYLKKYERHYNDEELKIIYDTDNIDKAWQRYKDAVLKVMKNNDDVSFDIAIRTVRIMNEIRLALSPNRYDFGGEENE